MSYRSLANATLATRLKDVFERARLNRHLGRAAAGLGALSPLMALANPTGGQVVGGAATIAAPNPNTTQITQTSQNAVINWQSFSVGANQYVQFLQPDSSATVLNRVIGSSPSNIFGNITANGQVFLVNSNGILFGKGAVLDVGSLVASTQDISDSDFMSGKYNFIKGSGAPDASVINQGAISASNGGYVVLAGDYVENDGTIQAQTGQVLLTAGGGTTLTLSHNQLIGYAINGATLANLAGVSNTGDITADGGTVIMNADVANALTATAVNNSGFVAAHSITTRDGVILLVAEGGGIENSGTLDASATDSGVAGGTIILRGNSLTKLDPTSVIDTEGDGANGGFIELSGHDLRMGGLTRVGDGGTLLLDPTTIKIIAGGASGLGTGAVNSIGTGYLTGQLSAHNVTLVAGQTITDSGATGLHINPTGGTGNLALKIGTLTTGGGGSLSGVGCVLHGICQPGTGTTFHPATGGTISLAGVTISVKGNFNASASKGTVTLANVTAGQVATVVGRNITAGSLNAKEIVIEGDSPGAISLGRLTATSAFAASAATVGGDAVYINAPGDAITMNGAKITALNGGVVINGGNITLGSISAGGKLSVTAHVAGPASASISVVSGKVLKAQSVTLSANASYGGKVNTGDIIATGGDINLSAHESYTAGSADVSTGALSADVGNIVVNQSGPHGRVRLGNLTAGSGIQIVTSETGDGGSVEFSSATAKTIFVQTAAPKGGDIEVTGTLKTTGFLTGSNFGMGIVLKASNSVASMSGGNIKIITGGSNVVHAIGGGVRLVAHGGEDDGGVIQVAGDIVATGLVDILGSNVGTCCGSVSLKNVTGNAGVHLKVSGAASDNKLSVGRVYAPSGSITVQGSHISLSSASAGNKLSISAHGSANAVATINVPSSHSLVGRRVFIGAGGIGDDGGSIHVGNVKAFNGSISIEANHFGFASHTGRITAKNITASYGAVFLNAVGSGAKISVGSVNAEFISGSVRGADAKFIAKSLTAVGSSASGGGEGGQKGFIKITQVQPGYGSNGSINISGPVKSSQGYVELTTNAGGAVKVTGAISAAKSVDLKGGDIKVGGSIDAGGSVTITQVGSGGVSIGGVSAAGPLGISARNSSGAGLVKVAGAITAEDVTIIVKGLSATFSDSKDITATGPSSGPYLARNLASCECGHSIGTHHGFIGIKTATSGSAGYTHPNSGSIKATGTIKSLHGGVAIVNSYGGMTLGSIVTARNVLLYGHQISVGAISAGSQVSITGVSDSTGPIKITANGLVKGAEVTVKANVASHSACTGVENSICGSHAPSHGASINLRGGASATGLGTSEGGGLKGIKLSATTSTSAAVTLNITSGPLHAAAGNITITDGDSVPTAHSASGNVKLTGLTSAAGGNVSIAQKGMGGISVGTVHAAGNVSISAFNSHGANNGITVNGSISAARVSMFASAYKSFSSVNVPNGGNVTILGNVTAHTGYVHLNAWASASGGNLTVGGNIKALNSSVSLHAGAEGRGGNISVHNISAGTGIDVSTGGYGTKGGNITVNGTVTVQSGNALLDAYASNAGGNLTVTGTISAPNGSVELEARGAGSSGGNIHVGNVTAASGASVFGSYFGTNASGFMVKTGVLTGSHVTVQAEGLNPHISAAGISASNNVKVTLAPNGINRSSGSVNITGPVKSSLGSVNFSATDAKVVTKAVTAATGITVLGGTINMGSLSAGSGDVNLKGPNTPVHAETITVTGPISAGHVFVDANVPSTATFGASVNLQGKVTATGNTHSAAAITIAARKFTNSAVGNMKITVAGLQASGGDISIGQQAAGGGVKITGLVSAADVRVHATGAGGISVASIHTQGGAETQGIAIKASGSHAGPITINGTVTAASGNVMLSDEGLTAGIVVKQLISAAKGSASIFTVGSGGVSVAGVKAHTRIAFNVSGSHAGPIIVNGSLSAATGGVAVYDLGSGGNNIHVTGAITAASGEVMLQASAGSFAGGKIKVDGKISAPKGDVTIITRGGGASGGNVTLASASAAHDLTITANYMGNSSGFKVKTGALTAQDISINMTGKAPHLSVGALTNRGSSSEVAGSVFLRVTANSGNKSSGSIKLNGLVKSSFGHVSISAGRGIVSAASAASITARGYIDVTGNQITLRKLTSTKGSVSLTGLSAASRSGNITVSGAITAASVNITEDYLATAAHGGAINLQGLVTSTGTSGGGGGINIESEISAAGKAMVINTKGLTANLHDISLTQMGSNGGITMKGAISAPHGTVTVTAAGTGGMSLSGGITALSNVFLRANQGSGAHGPVTVTGDIKAGGQVFINASGSGNNDITVNGNITASSEVDLEAKSTVNGGDIDVTGKISSSSYRVVLKTQGAGASGGRINVGPISARNIVSINASYTGTQTGFLVKTGQITGELVHISATGLAPQLSVAGITATGPSGSLCECGSGFIKAQLFPKHSFSGSMKFTGPVKSSHGSVTLDAGHATIDMGGNSISAPGGSSVGHVTISGGQLKLANITATGSIDITAHGKGSHSASISAPSTALFTAPHVTLLVDGSSGSKGGKINIGKVSATGTGASGSSGEVKIITGGMSSEKLTVTTGKLTAARLINVTLSNASGSANLGALSAPQVSVQLQNGALTVGGITANNSAVDLRASNGALSVNAGSANLSLIHDTLTAGTTLTIKAGKTITLTNDTLTHGSKLSISAGGSLTLTDSPGSIDVSGATLKATKKVDLTASASINIANAKIAGSVVDITGRAIINGSAGTLSAGGGSITANSFGISLNNEKMKLSGSGLTLKTHGGAVDLFSAAVTGNGDLTVQASDGSVYTKNLHMTGAALNISGGNVNLLGASINVTGALAATAGFDISLGAATLIGSGVTLKTLSGAGITNNNLADTIKAGAGGVLIKSNNGEHLNHDTITVTGGSAQLSAGGTLDLVGASIGAGKALTIKGNLVDLSGGAKLAGSAADVTAHGSISATGITITGGAGGVSLKGAVVRLIGADIGVTGGAALISAGSGSVFANSATLTAGKSMTLDAGATVYLAKAHITGSAVNMHASAITNSTQGGSITAGGGLIKTTGAIFLNGETLHLSGAGETLSAASNLEVRGAHVTGTGNLTLNGGEGVSASSLRFSGGSFKASAASRSVSLVGATIGASKAVDVTAKSNINVFNNATIAGSSLHFTATSGVVDGAGSGQISGSKGVHITAAGEIALGRANAANGSLVLHAGGSLNALSGRLNAGKKVIVTAGGRATISGTNILGSGVSITAASVHGGSGGSIKATTGGMSIKTTSLLTVAGETLTVTGGNLTLSAGTASVDIQNATGHVAGNVTIKAARGLAASNATLTAGGFIHETGSDAQLGGATEKATGALTLTTTGNIKMSGAALSGSAVDLTATAGSIGASIARATVTAGTGGATLKASSFITLPSLTLHAGGAALISAGNSIDLTKASISGPAAVTIKDTVGNINLGTASVKAGGLLKVSAKGTALVSGASLSGSGVNIAAAGVNNGGVGTLKAGAGGITVKATGSVLLNSEAITLTGAGNASFSAGVKVGLNGVTLVTGGAVTLTGNSVGISGDTLKAGKALTVTAKGNGIGLDNSLSGSAVTLTAAGAVSDGNAGHNITAGAGGITITATHQVNLTGETLKTTAGNAVISGATLNLASAHVTAGKKVTVNGTTDVTLTGAVLNASSAAMTATAGNIDLSGITLTTTNLTQLTAKQTIVLSGVNITTGTLSATAQSGSIHNGGGPGAISAQGMYLKAKGNISLGSTAITLGNQAAPGSAGDTNLIAELSVLGIQPTSSTLNGAFLAGGTLILDSLTMTGHYLMLQGTNVSIQGSVTVPTSGFLVQLMPADPTASIGIEDAPATTETFNVSNQGFFALFPGDTIAIGSDNESGAAFVGTNGPFTLAPATNLFIDTTGQVTGLNLVTSTGVVTSLIAFVSTTGGVITPGQVGYTVGVTTETGTGDQTDKKKLSGGGAGTANGQQGGTTTQDSGTGSVCH